MVFLNMSNVFVNAYTCFSVLVCVSQCFRVLLSAYLRFFVLFSCGYMCFSVRLCVYQFLYVIVLSVFASASCAYRDRGNDVTECCLAGHSNPYTRDPGCPGIRGSVTCLT